MSLLKWQELAKSKANLGHKINQVRNTITQKTIDEQSSQSSFQKIFKPVTTKLDDVIDSKVKMPPRKRVKKGMRGDLEAPDYYPEVDPFEDMDIEGMLEPEPVKQIPIQPPSYSEVVDQEGPDYGLFTEDEGRFTEAEGDEETLYPGSDEDEEDTDDDTEVESGDEIKLEDFNLPSLEDVKTELVDKKNKMIYLKNIIGKATHERNKLKGYKSGNSKKYKAGKITATEAKRINDQLDSSNKGLTAYINDNKKLLETFRKKGSGIRRKQKGGNVIFFNDPEKLLKKLEIIIGSKNAGNSSVELRNMGVAILDILLKMSIINKQQYNKLYKMHFKI